LDARLSSKHIAAGVVYRKHNRWSANSPKRHSMFGTC
jgi:hypothetical protein